MFEGRPEACTALQSSGDSTNWHWSMVIVLDTNGYSIFFYCWLQVKPCVAFPGMSWSYYIVPWGGYLEKSSCLICGGPNWIYPYPYNYWILIGGGGISIFWLPPGDGIERWAWLLDRCNFPVKSQMNSRRYHLVFCTVTRPSVACADLENMYRPMVGLCR